MLPKSGSERALNCCCSISKWLDLKRSALISLLFFTLLWRNQIWVTSGGKNRVSPLGLNVVEPMLRQTRRVTWVEGWGRGGNPYNGGGGGTANVQFCAASSFPCCEGQDCHITIRGSGSPPAEGSIVSSLLNRNSEVQPLLWHPC